MKIIISPTKTMKRKEYIKQVTHPIFLAKSKKLRLKMAQFNKEDLQKSLKISDKLTEIVYGYYHGNNESMIQAINLYEGASFKAMDLPSWHDDDFEFLQDHLYILSAMYGALRPYDEITEYRLDYLTKLDINLYDYWGKEINTLLQEDALIINLASNEFTKDIEHENMINIIFLDEQERNLSTQAKQARGDMVQYIVKNRIQEPQKIKAYHNLNYKFIDFKSDQNNYVFIKQKSMF